MSGIAIFMEGGGKTASTRSLLRLGMKAFLSGIEDGCRQRKWKWNLVACGSRNEAYRKFIHFRDARYHIVVLLVDSEGQIEKNQPPHQYLTDRDGGV